MKILFTMCGRAGSKGIKNKNARMFLGKPLALYTLSGIDLFLSRNAEVEYDIVLNTDSPELEAIVQSNRMRDVTMIPRREDLAGDAVGKVDVIRDCFRKMSEENEYEMVVDLDLTSPLRCARDIEHVVMKKHSESYDVVFTVVESRRNPYFNMVTKDKTGSYSRVITSDFTARQQAPEIFDMNASIYAYDPSFLENNNNIFDGRCGIVEMPDTGVLDLDRQIDFEMMEVIGEYLLKSDPLFKEVRDNIKFDL